MPSIYQPKTENGFRAKIGYITDTRGRRVRKEFRLGNDPLVAYKTALQLAEKWMKEEQQYRSTQTAFSEVLPSDPRPLPVWTGMPEILTNGHASYHALPPDDLPGDQAGECVVPGTTIERASRDLLGRIKSKAERDAKSFSTHSWYEQQFRLGFVLPALDPQMPVNGITLGHIEQFCDYWCDLRHRASETKKKSFKWQTATNRIDAFAYFLRDMKGRLSGFSYPERADAVFDEAKRTVAGDLTAIQTFSSDRLKAIFKKGNDRLRLTVYCALNFGMYQADIGQQIRRQHGDADGGITEIDGEVYLQWNRHKLKRRQRALRRDKDEQQRAILLTHYVWPETLSLLRKFAAPENNAKNLWLLNEDGLPLWRHEGGQKRPLDNISTAYYRATKLAKVSQPFDQFRKFGATACESLGFPAKHGCGFSFSQRWLSTHSV